MSQPTAGRAPRIVITVAVATNQAEPQIAERKNRLYADGIRRHGGDPILLDAQATTAERSEAFARMDGLMLSGGADIDPAGYGRPNQGSVDLEPDRDELEAQAWAAASTKGVPVVGICRGFQAINVFAGGTLIQDVGGHASAGWGHGPATMHPVRLAPGSRLARILSPAKVHVGPMQVNSYHHQGVRPTDLAPGLTASAWANSPAGELVEAFEAADGRFLFGVQCHPERTESTPTEFERLWAFFVAACRGPVTVRDRRA